MYQRRRHRRRPIHGPRQGLGDIASALGEIGSALSTASTVARDPYFAEALCRMDELHAVKTGQMPKPCTLTPPQPSPAGLDKAVMGLRAYVFAEENPWAYPVAALAAIGIPLWIGYQLGKR